jgi:hypothetical protein
LQTTDYDRQRKKNKDVERGKGIVMSDEGRKVQCVVVIGIYKKLNEGEGKS